MTLTDKCTTPAEVTPALPVTLNPCAPGTGVRPLEGMLRDIQAGFGRSWILLPGVFGVPRQNWNYWQAGSQIPARHLTLMQQLATAERVFQAAGFTTTPGQMGRTVAQGKSWLRLLGDGADGAESAHQLMRLVQRKPSWRQSWLGVTRSNCRFPT